MRGELKREIPHALWTRRGSLLIQSGVARCSVGVVLSAVAIKLSPRLGATREGAGAIAGKSQVRIGPHAKSQDERILFRRQKCVGAVETVVEEVEFEGRRRVKKKLIPKEGTHVFMANGGPRRCNQQPVFRRRLIHNEDANPSNNNGGRSGKNAAGDDDSYYHMNRNIWR